MLFKSDPRVSEKHDTTSSKQDPGAGAKGGGKANHLQRMTVTYFARMGLFTQELSRGEDDEKFIVTYHPPPFEEGEEKSLKMRFEPDVQGLEELEVDLHGSKTRALNMGSEVNKWFSSCFGWEVICVYMPLGNTREVLGNLSPNNAVSEGGRKSWFSAITAYVPEYFMEKDNVVEEGITFADCAPFLVVTEESIKDVSTRLPDGIEVDVTKFRPNIVLEGAEEAYEEDFWGRISIVPNSSEDRVLEIILTQNCIRCQSLDIDYRTGTFGRGQEKTVLKKLMRDRRVDAGKKHSPVFGRYGFLGGKEESRAVTVTVGDEVHVTKRNQERTKFCRVSRDAHVNREGRHSLDQQSAFPHDGRAQRRLGSQHGPPTRTHPQAISLEDGISDLYDSVDDAIQHFSHFEQEFHQDIHRIRSYCETRLLEAVWMQKTRPVEKMTRDRQRNTQRGHSAEQEDANRSPPSLRSTMRQLMSSLDAALASAEEFHPSQRRPTRYSAEDAVRIRQQLHRSYQSLRKSFSVVVQKRSEMESLNTELEMLKVFLSRNGAENRDGGGGGPARVGGGRHTGVADEVHDERAWDEPGEKRQEWGGAEDGGHGNSRGLDHASLHWLTD
ncbi:MAG: hypothetical protein Q9188_007458 [Gyalolechia gomerana]